MGLSLQNENVNLSLQKNVKLSLFFVRIGLLFLLQKQGYCNNFWAKQNAFIVTDGFIVITDYL